MALPSFIELLEWWGDLTDGDRRNFITLIELENLNIIDRIPDNKYREMALTAYIINSSTKPLSEYELEEEI